ncbi:hypothetical protein JW899_04240 [Candidatus Uhrbacteria bacterium]|nr:hypothetical protein [Candidatus Uhrbacteria bacterium]
MKRRKIPYMSFEEWKELGAMVNKMHNIRLEALSYAFDERLPNVHQRNGQPGKPVKIGDGFLKVEKALTELSNRLDSVVFDAYPEKTTKELSSVFYGWGKVSNE